MKTYHKIISSFTFVLLCWLGSAASVQAANRDEVIFFFNDSLGSAVAAVSESGELCWSEQYTAYGDKAINDDLVSTVGCGIVGEERGFTGHTEDVNSDLVYMQQRYYDPSIGRFLSIDPVESNPNKPATFNRYAYANNNPYRYTDPTGEILFDTIFDAVSVVYDVGKIGVGYATGNYDLVRDGVVDLTGDIGALLTPYVPAGGTKVARALAKAQDKVPKSGGNGPSTKVEFEQGLTKNSAPQIKTDQTFDQAIQTLETSGFTKKPFKAQNGGTGYVLSNDQGKVYRAYPNSTSGGEDTLQAILDGVTTSKIRLGN